MTYTAITEEGAKPETPQETAAFEIMLYLESKSPDVFRRAFKQSMMDASLASIDEVFEEFKAIVNAIKP